MGHFIRSIFLSLLIFCVAGCTAVKYIVMKKTDIGIPQVVAYLQPAVKDNQLLVFGKVVMQNLHKSDLKLGKIFIDIKDENDIVLNKATFDWKGQNVDNRYVEAPIYMRLPLSVLSRKQIALFMDTQVTYQLFHLDFPIQSKLAVLDLEMLKKTIIRPLDISVYTKVYTTISGDASADFTFNITNPTEAQLLLRHGKVSVYTREIGSIAEMNLSDVLFLPGHITQIKDNMSLGNIFGTILTHKLLSKYPLRLRISGEMTIPDTDIFMPFSIESVQEIDFSLLPNKPAK